MKPKLIILILLAIAGLGCERYTKNTVHIQVPDCDDNDPISTFTATFNCQTKEWKVTKNHEN